MKKNIKKILIFIIVSTFTIPLLIWAFIAIKNNDNMLLNLSEFREIQSKMMSYHLDYGRYPIVSEDIILKEYILCDDGFIKKDQKCKNLVWDPKNLTLDFIYKKNTEGLDYFIQFEIKEDNKYLKCIHTIKENKKGCKYTYSLGYGLSVER